MTNKPASNDTIVFILLEWEGKVTPAMIVAGPVIIGIAKDTVVTSIIPSPKPLKKKYNT